MIGKEKFADNRSRRLWFDHAIDLYLDACTHISWHICSGISILFCILQLGNLLQLGSIIFAPDSPEVTALVEYLTNSTEVPLASFPTDFHLSHASRRFCHESFKSCMLKLCLSFRAVFQGRLWWHLPEWAGKYLTCYTRLWLDPPTWKET